MHPANMLEHMKFLMVTCQLLILSQLPKRHIIANADISVILGYIFTFACITFTSEFGKASMKMLLLSLDSARMSYFEKHCTSSDFHNQKPQHSANRYFISKYSTRFYFAQAIVLTELVHQRQQLLLLLQIPYDNIQPCVISRT